jgi:hypothetical protein
MPLGYHVTAGSPVKSRSLSAPGRDSYDRGHEGRRGRAHNGPTAVRGRESGAARLVWVTSVTDVLEHAVTPEAMKAASAAQETPRPAQSLAETTRPAPAISSKMTRARTARMSAVRQPRACRLAVLGGGSTQVRIALTLAHLPSERGGDELAAAVAEIGAPVCDDRGGRLGMAS